MSFFKDFKEDLSHAVNELLPGEEVKKEEPKEEADKSENTLESELDVESELSKLDGLLEKVTKDEKDPNTAANKIRTINAAPAVKTKAATAEGKVNQTVENLKKVEEDKNMSEQNNGVSQANTPETSETPMMDGEISDETSIITEGTRLKGNMESPGSFDIRGTIQGDVTCNGKLVVTGTIIGNSASSEFFADAAKIEGEVVSTGTVKVGLGSVIIGNITATSAVIAGAIKGDIDVQGPVVVDTSAVVMGNIKSRSVQINNGAVIEGFCSQCYADIDVESLFGDKKVK